MLKLHSRAEVGEMIGGGRAVVQQLLFGEQPRVGPWLSRVEQLLDDELEEREFSEIWTCRDNLRGTKAEHIVLDSSFRMLSVLETIEQGYEFERNN
jgi:hypothetical protein